MYRKGHKEEDPLNELKKMKQKFNTIKPKIKSLRIPAAADEMAFIHSDSTVKMAEAEKEKNGDKNGDDVSKNKPKSKNIYQVKRRVDYEILHGIIRPEGNGGTDGD